jgi:cardiolipin synthase
MEIYEYQPTVLHAKMAMADNELVTLGSFNVNNISAYASIELNLDIKDKEFCGIVQQELEKIQRDSCVAITDKTYTTKLFSFRQFLQWGAFQLIRFTLTISTFYFRQKRE